MPPRDVTTLDPAQAIGRREVLLGMLALPMLAAGISCGDDDDDGATAESVTIEDAFGQVTIPAKPERIVAVRHHHIGNMLALGVVPVGMVPEAAEFPLPGDAEQLAGVTNVRASGDWELDIEKALALDPDLILEMSGQEGDAWNQEICDRAKAAASTACFVYGYSTDAEVKQNMTDVGEALGLQDRASELIGEYDERLESLKADTEALADKKVATIFWVNFGDGDIIYVAADQASNLVIRSLGIPQPDFQNDPSIAGTELSFEQIEVLNEAWAVIVMPQGSATPESLEADPLWQLLEPAQAGRVVFVDGEIWGQDYIPALMHMLDDVESLLLPLADA